MTCITSFPVELILLILRWLNCFDLSSLAQSCKFFRDICELDDIWQYFCKRDCRIYSVDEWCVDSFKELYRIVLFKYGYLIGSWWKISIHPYGGILSVEAEPGRIVAYLMLPSKYPDITMPFRKKEVFEIKVKDKYCVCNCQSGKTVHPLDKLNVTQRNMNSIPPAKFSFECLHRMHHPESDINSDEFDQWLYDEFCNGLPPVLLLAYAKYEALTALSGNIECEMIKWPDCDSVQSLPTPGLYKGTYSAHGIEVIMVEVSDGKIIGTKITGDPNVPATEITFKANINEVVTLDEINQLQRFPWNSFDGEEYREQVSVTEFRLPYGFGSDYVSHPTTVKSRYHGVGQIAGHGYTEPSWTPNQFIVFNKNLFGVLWIELHNLNVYYRVER